MTNKEKWDETLRNEGFIKALISRELAPFKPRHDKDLIVEGLIAYYETLDKIYTTGTRWRAIKYKLWEYIDNYITGHKNRNRKEQISVVNMSVFDSQYESEDASPSIEPNFIEKFFMVDESATTFEQAYQEELIHKIKNQLGHFDNKILSLMYLGYTQVEIAEELNVPVYIVYNHLKIIRKAARKVAKGYDAVC